MSRLTFAKTRCNSGSGFMLAPLLYMLALAGIGAAVMFSGYSQVLRSNAEMTAINTARQQLQSAGQTLSATSVLDSATSSIVQPPGVTAFASVTDSARLPTGYASAQDSSGTDPPNDVGVVSLSSGVRQLDPWGKYYIYCRWENAVSDPSKPSIMVMSAGPDGELETKCTGASASGDDRMTRLTVAEAINRANTWQVTSNTQVKFGIDTDAVKVNQDGTLQAKSLTLTGSGTVLTATGNITVGSITASSMDLTSPLPVTEGGTGASTAGTARANLGSTTIGDALFTAADAATARTTLGATATGVSLFTAADAAAGRTALGATATGTAVFTAGSAGAARTTLGSTSVGDAVFTASSAGAARATLGSTSVGDALFIAANAAAGRSALALGTMAVQDASAVAITGGTITGVDLTGSTIPGSGVTGTVSNSTNASSVPASGITGILAVTQGGTGASDAATARSNLGANDATNLTAGTLAWARLPDSGVVAGDYGWGVVNAKGIVTSASVIQSSQISQGDSSVAVSDSGSNGAVTFTTDGAVAMVIDNQGRVGIGTSSPGQKLDVAGNIRIQRAAGNDRTLFFGTNTSNRWAITANSTAESGSNAGSDFVITKYADNGTTATNVFSITRSTSAAAFAGDVGVGGVVSATGGFVGNLTGNVVGNLTGNVTGNVNGNLTGNVTGLISLGDGTVSSPGIYFTSDTDTGIWRPGNDIFGIAAGGKDVARFTGSTTAVNYLNFASAATGSAVGITATGSDASVGLTLTPKGSGTIALAGPSTVTGTLGASGDFAVATNKFTVASPSGNTAVAGTLDVTGASTFNSTVGIGTASVVSTALLQMHSTTKGFLPPRMTTTQRDAISSPATGLTVYNTTTNAMNVYNGTSWVVVGGGSIIQDTDNNTSVQTEANPNEDKIRFTTAGVLRAIIDENGKVGINSALPAYPLDVVGRTRSSSYLVTAVTGGSAPQQSGGYSGGWSVTGTDVYKISGNVGLGTSAVASGVTIDMSGRTDSVILPKGTTGQQPGTGISGMIRFNTTTGQFEGYTGSAWSSFAQGGVASQWTTTGSDIYFTTGKVGIGTASPGDRLEVVDGDAGGVNSIHISGGRSASYAGGILFKNSYWNAGDYGAAAIRALDTGSQGGRLAFYTTANSSGATGAPSERVRIDESGNVGIGTASPNAKLQVVGSGGAGQAVQIDSQEVKFRGDGVAHFSLFANRVSGALTIDNTGNSAANGAGALLSNLMTIQTGGNVGIATSAPSERLQVYGKTTLSRSAVAECCSSGNYTLALSEDTSSSGNTASIQFHNAGVAEGYMRLANGGQRRFQFGDYQSVGTGLQMSGPLYVDSTANTYVMGNVGIGLTSPAQKLDVNGYVRIRSINGEGGTIVLDGNNGTTMHLENINGTFRLVNSPWTAGIFGVDQSGNVSSNGYMKSSSYVASNGLGEAYGGQGGFNGNYYHSQINDSWFPYPGNNYNYIRGNTIMADGGGVVNVYGSGVSVYGAQTYCGGYRAYAWWGYGDFNQCMNYGIYSQYPVLAGEFDIPSDIRRKKDIAPIAEEEGLDFVRRVKPVRFHWNRDPAGQAKTTGYIAQQLIAAGYRELVKVSPTPHDEVLAKRQDVIDGVVVDSPEDTAFAANYIGAIPLLHSALKELDRKDTGLARVVEELKARNDRLEAEIKELKGQVEGIRRQR